jgi:hypothetical protein
MAIEVCSYNICPAWDVSKDSLKGGKTGHFDTVASIMIKSKERFVNAFYALDLSEGIRGLGPEEYKQTAEEIQDTLSDEELKFIASHPSFIRGVYGCVEKMLTTTDCTLENIARLPGVEG